METSKEGNATSIFDGLLQAATSWFTDVTEESKGIEEIGFP
jgi:hypothetical protein